MTSALPHHDDQIIPFQLVNSGLRGRMIRLGATLDDILGKHHYPTAVAALLAEAATLAAVMGSLMKDEGVFSLQAKGDGPVRLLVADYMPGGALRAYAAFDETRLANATSGFNGLLGDGYLAFTIDRDSDAGRYQGIVEITGSSLASAVQHYFLQSDQIRTDLKLFVAPKGKFFQVATICLQAVPLESMAGFNDLDVLPTGWDEATTLLGTLTAAEALNAATHPHDVLYRLFHEGGVRVDDTIHVMHRCRCSLERAERALSALPDAEASALLEKDCIEVRCEFCNSTYQFTLEEVKKSRRED